MEEAKADDASIGDQGKCTQTNANTYLSQGADDVSKPPTEQKKETGLRVYDK